MLKIQDEKTGEIRYILRDEDDEPLSVDELVLQDEDNNKKDSKGKDK